MVITKKLFALTVALWMLLLSSPVAAGSLTDEYQVKAAILYNFAKFIKWPPGSLPEKDTPFIFSIITRDPLSGWGAEIESRTIQGHKVIVRQFRTVGELDQPCQVLFIHRSMEQESQQIIERMRNRPVLTVGDEIDLARRGGIVNFIKADNKIRFEVNIDAASRIELNISSDLLKLANIVDTGTQRN